MACQILGAWMGTDTSTRKRTCRQCRNEIPAKELHVRVSHKSGYYTDNDNYHLACWEIKKADMIQKLRALEDEGTECFATNNQVQEVE